MLVTMATQLSGKQSRREADMPSDTYICSEWSGGTPFCVSGQFPFIFSHSLPHSPSCFFTPAACLLKDFFSCSVALFLSLHLHPHLSCLSFLLLLLLHFVKRLQLNYVSPFSLCNCIFFLLFFLTLGLNTAVRVEYRNLVIVVKE